MTAAAEIPYTTGLHEIASGVHAWLAPDGGWGLSNAGLVCGDGASFLVDTLYDLRLTRTMLDAMAPVTAAHPITAALNTHANGDHCYGNELLAPEVRIHAVTATAHDMAHDAPPPVMAELMSAEAAEELGPELATWLRKAFGAYEFAGITQRQPDVLFDEALTLEVGGRAVQLRNLGPAHTEGDAIAWVPDAGVVFTGDLLFIGGAPIIWAGPVASWVRACDELLALSPELVVPGHGPVTDGEGIRAVRGYLGHVQELARESHSRGLSWMEAALRADLGEYAGLSESERIAPNLHHAYRELDPSLPPLDPTAALAAMARWDAERGGGGSGTRRNATPPPASSD
ncbi:glyoxylase-like metal-dependent hydrolase (beta-lactamase superfamily II) [Crossiella equi]|uniref:Glyoxylase-like metal-dependent hydrolase (Beta-lactamase superfamily II) n=1 Tax=Crossiella equi TaxID=130796 RepID=A0ABS5A7G7_9PSEU|nr:MBL fold metallo-hydrolase [Crossiella equi]MBP2472537.1 glyoxylase-like metal-dependent hydrolase (beta-lactamase superfamily II) [Crossiella equi]